jgi:hypothetical protein
LFVCLFVVSFNFYPLFSSIFRLTKVDDGDSVDSSSEQSTGEITALIGPRGPSPAEIRAKAQALIAKSDKQVKEGRERRLANMDVETQHLNNQVEASRQALIKQQETQIQSSKASRFATPKNCRTPKHKTRSFQAHRVSADHFTPLKDKKSGIQAPGSSSMTPHDRFVKSSRKEHKETREHIRKDLAEVRDDLKENNEQQHKNTQNVINRNVRAEHCKTRRDNNEGWVSFVLHIISIPYVILLIMTHSFISLKLNRIKQLEHKLMSELAEQRQILAEYVGSNCPVESINYRSTATTAASSSSSSRKPRRVKTAEKKRWK